jgi:signal transduction protein with GAF and PtsI domain
VTANEIIQSVAGIATATGVGIGAAQIWIGRRQERKSALQERAAFEQQFVERYRQVVARIPLKFLLDSAVYDADDEKARRAFYDYFELCEDELFQNSQSETISPGAWAEWESGIRANFRRPAFRGAWDDLSAAASEQLDELRHWFEMHGSS